MTTPEDAAPPDLSTPDAVPQILWDQINATRDTVLQLAKGSPELAKTPTWLMVTALMAAAIRIGARAGVASGVLKGMFSYFWEQEKQAKGAAPAAPRGGERGAVPAPGPKGWKKVTDTTDLGAFLSSKSSEPRS